MWVCAEAALVCNTIATTTPRWLRRLLMWSGGVRCARGTPVVAATALVVTAAAAVVVPVAPSVAAAGAMAAAPRGAAVQGAHAPGRRELGARWAACATQRTQHANHTARVAWHDGRLKASKREPLLVRAVWRGGCACG